MATDDEVDKAKLAQVLAEVPKGSAIVAGSAVAIVVAIWFAFYFFAFLRGGLNWLEIGGAGSALVLVVAQQHAFFPSCILVPVGRPVTTHRRSRVALAGRKIGETLVGRLEPSI